MLRRAWSVRTLSGNVITSGNDSVGHGRSRTPLHYFLAVFPQEKLSRMTQLTSAKLMQRGASSTTRKAGGDVTSGL